MRRINNKGFTLIELLAVIAILALVTTVTIVSVISYFGTATDKAEEVFVRELSNIIEDYIGLKANTFNFTKNDSITCSKVSCPIYVASNAFKLEDLVTEELTTQNDLINPKTSTSCDVNSLITVYRSSNYVYCFKASLDCYVDEAGISKEINTCDF